MKNGEKENQAASDIDYLHPDGKPGVSASQVRDDKEAREKPINQKSLDEADGHHMCNNSCKSKHRDSNEQE